MEMEAIHVRRKGEMIDFPTSHGLRLQFCQFYAPTRHSVPISTPYLGLIPIPCWIIHENPSQIRHMASPSSDDVLEYDFLRVRLLCPIVVVFSHLLLRFDLLLRRRRHRTTTYFDYHFLRT